MDVRGRRGAEVLPARSHNTWLPIGADCYICCMWVDVLIDAGVDVALPSPDEVRLNEGPALRLVTLDRPLRGRDMNGLDGPGLLVATRIGPTLRARLQANAWSWVAEDAQEAHVAGLDIVVGHPRETTDPGVRPRWPRGHATFAIVRALLLAGRADQATLAGCADCSQPLVSRTLRRLAGDGLVHGRRGEWRPGPDLARWWLDRYPGPGGTTLHLWAPGGPWDNAEPSLTHAIRRAWTSRSPVRSPRTRPAPGPTRPV